MLCVDVSLRALGSGGSKTQWLNEEAGDEEDMRI
jgi:hypothetical protein